MRPILDLTLRHFTRPKGDITLIGSWIEVDGRHRPCLVLIATADEGRETAVPCVVTLDKAWIWSEDVGDGARAAQIAFSFCEALRLTADPHNIIRVASLIHDHLGDLLAIPPWRAPKVEEAVAEVTITERSSGKTAEVSL